MSAIWNGFVTALEQVLRLLFELTNSGGLAIIVFTIAVKVILLPITLRQLRSSREMQKLQPQIRALQKKYAKDREKLNQEMMQLYREHGVNPMAGCLPSLLQFPIFFGVYYAVLNLSRVPTLGALVSRWAGFASAAFLGAGSIPGAQELWEGLSQGVFANQPFLWMPSIGRPDPWHLLPILAGVFQLIQQRMMTPREGGGDPQQTAMSNTMMFMPLMIVFIGWNFPAGPVLYWVTQSLFGIVQQYFISGWGALKNWLPFLPERERPEQSSQPKPQSTPVPQGEETTSSGGVFGWLLGQMERMSGLQEQAEQPDQAEQEGVEETEAEEKAALPPAPTKRRSRR